MGFFDSLKSVASKATSDLTDQFNRIKNKDVMEAVVAGCTYVAYADGNVSSSEKTKMLGFLQHTECLKMYKTDEVVNAFNKYSGKFDFDGSIGKSETLAALGKVKDHEERKLVVRACVIIANSDNNFDESEKKVVREICSLYSLNPSDYV